jgi:hypothetical protein
MAKTGRIHHPRSGEHTNHPHFAAFGKADRTVTAVQGILTNERTG